MSTPKRKLKRLVRKYLDTAGADYTFVRVSETDIKNHLGVSSSDWDPLAAYYVKNCLVDGYLGLGHNLYPSPEVFTLDSTKPLVEKFDLFPIADLAGAQVALRLTDGEVFEIASETFTMDYWDGEFDGVHETSLLDYFDSLGLDPSEGYEPVVPDEIRLAHLEAKTPEEVRALDEEKQTSLLRTLIPQDNFDMVKLVLDVMNLKPDSKLESRSGASVLDFCAQRCRSPEMVRLLVRDYGFRFNRIEMYTVKFLVDRRRDLLDEFIKLGAFVPATSARYEIIGAFESRGEIIPKELQ